VKRSTFIKLLATAVADPVVARAPLRAAVRPDSVEPLQGLIEWHSGGYWPEWATVTTLVKYDEFSRFVIAAPDKTGHVHSKTVLIHDAVITDRPGPGRNSEIAYYTAKKGMEIGRDIAFAHHGHDWRRVVVKYQTQVVEYQMQSRLRTIV